MDTGPEPLDVCDITSSSILIIGPLSELLRHQPDNEEAKMRLREANDMLARHVATCEKCRLALEVEEEA